jgi:prepilin-type N-terminal cleavage/methylation domain-containing protein
MKKISSARNLWAFTLIELLVVVIILAVVVALALPTNHNARRKAQVVGCLNNLRQIGIGMMMFTGDYTNNFPWQVSSTNGGSLESIPSGSPAAHFKTVTNYIKNLPDPLLCPTDKARRPPEGGQRIIADTNISYFLNMDSALDPNTPIAGDRNLEVTGKRLPSGLAYVPPYPQLNWGPGLHNQTANLGCGIMAFGDGHTEYTKSNSLATISRRWSTTNRLAIP